MNGAKLRAMTVSERPTYSNAALSSWGFDAKPPHGARVRDRN